MLGMAMEEATAGTRVLLGDQRKGILALTIPIAVALLIQQINNIVDSLWVAGLGADPMAAIGAVYPIYCVLIGIGNGLGIGASAAIARNIGRDNRKDANGVASQALVLTIIVSLAMMLVLMVTAEGTMGLMGVGDMVGTCLDYAYPIYFCTLPIILSGVLSGMLRGEGQARRSMWIQAVGAIVNIILDPVLIYGLDMGVAGAAWATGIAFAVSCVIGLYWYVRGKGMYIRIGKGWLTFDARLQKEILTVGMPEAIELSVMNLFNIFLNYYVIFCGGTDALAIYSTAWRVVYILMIPAQAVGGAMVAVCSAESAMGRFDMVRDAFRYSVMISVSALVLLSAVMVVFSGPIASAFTYSDELKGLHGEMVRLLHYFALFLPVMSLVYTGSSLMQALQHAGGAMVNTLVRNILLVALFAAGAYMFGTLDSLWWALTIGEIIGGIMMGIHAVRTLGLESSQAPGGPANAY